jgi:hypothetical protein
MGNANIKYNIIDSGIKDQLQAKLKELYNKDDKFYIDYWYQDNKYSIMIDGHKITFDNITNFIEFLNCIDRMYIIDDDPCRIRFVYGTIK